MIPGSLSRPLLYQNSRRINGSLFCLTRHRASRGKRPDGAADDRRFAIALDAVASGVCCEVALAAHRALPSRVACLRQRACCSTVGVQAITGTASLNARFPGQWFQSETGLHYNWHRSYDPTLGRYTQPDPLGFVDGPSVYAYAGGSPLRRVDLDGRNSIAIGGARGGGAGAAAGAGIMAG